MPHLEPERLVLLALGEETLDHDETGHLDACEQCRAEMASLRHVAGLGRETSRLQALPPPPEHVWQRIRAELAASGRAQPPPAVTLHSDPPPAWSEALTAAELGQDDAAPGDVPDNAAAAGDRPGDVAAAGDVRDHAPSGGEIRGDGQARGPGTAGSPEARDAGARPRDNAGADTGGGANTGDGAYTRAGTSANASEGAYTGADISANARSGAYAGADAGARQRRNAGGRAREQRRWWRVTVAVGVAAAVVSGLVAAGGTAWWMRRTDTVAGCRAQDARVTLRALPGAPPGAGGYACLRMVDGERRLVVRAEGMPVQNDADYEAWLLDRDEPSVRMEALGVLGKDSALTVPASLDLSKYNIIDISVEPHDGNAAHSGQSMLRGTLR